MTKHLSSARLVAVSTIFQVANYAANYASAFGGQWPPNHLSPWGLPLLDLRALLSVFTSHTKWSMVIEHVARGSSGDAGVSIQPSQNMYV